MGNKESSVCHKRLQSLLPAEQAEIEQSFENLCRRTNSKKTLSLAGFQDCIGHCLPSTTCRHLFLGIQGESSTGKASPPAPEITKEQYALFVVDMLRGTAEEKTGVVTRMIAFDDKDEVTGHKVQQFLEDLILGVVKALLHENKLSGWTLENTRDYESGARTLATQLRSQLKQKEGQTLEETEQLNTSYTPACVEEWLYKAAMISTLLRVVVTLGLSVMKQSPEHQRDLSALLPRRKKQTSRSLLDLPSIMFLNGQLPYDMQHRWRLLFSTDIHGESFSQLCGRLIDQGPSLLVLRDSDCFIFGGFASHNWEVKPQFQGDSRCFLFTVSPRLEIYTYTGYNDHYMYLNHGQQTMPNGLGMGGQHEYFGLWIDSNFGRGHSKAKPRCTTYNSPQLSSKEDFTIDAMEVWALGDLPDDLQAKNKKSILDADPESRALLEMTGRTRQSDGLRDKGQDEDS